MKAINLFSISQLHLRQYEYNHKTSAYLSLSLSLSLTPSQSNRVAGINFRTSEISGDLFTLPYMKSSRPIGFRRF